MRLSALRLSLIFSFLLLTLGGCQWLRPYSIDIRQGSLIDGEMVARLKPGMSAEQVKFILGTPLLTDPFHASRWDYPYQYRAPRGTKVESRRFSVFFKDGKLERWEGDIKAVTGNEEAQNRVVEIAPAKR